LIITHSLAATRGFYVDALGCRVVMDMPGYLQVAFAAGDDAPELAFCTVEVGEKYGMSVAPHTGSGLIISIPTQDVDAWQLALQTKGVPIDSAVADRPWGWRSLVARDPNGVRLDFFRPVSQAAGLDATG
jgi:catechol 2,3-dioxygenase-like lactoylglutathione lyase family enzyme